jgi:molybdate transport system substrate-binding protein
MSNSSMKKLALGLSAATVLWSASADAQVANLQVFTNVPFSNTAVELSYSFAAAYSILHNLNYNFGIGVMDDGSIESAIIGQNNGQPPTGPYGMDVAFFTTPEIPEYLARHYPQLIVGRPFPVAVDSLLLYSSSVNISAGLPSPLTTQIVIPDPTYYNLSRHLDIPNDNFGVAAAEVLEQWPWRIPTWTISLPGSLVANGGAVGTTYAALKFGDFPYGFINRAAVCRADSNGNNQKYNAPFYDVYEPFGKHPYNPMLVTVTAVHLARTRDAYTETAVNDLVAYLKGKKDSFGNVQPQGQNLIRSYCYTLPETFWGAAFLDH